MKKMQGYNQKCIEILKTIIESDNREIDDLKKQNKILFFKFDQLKSENEKLKRENENENQILKIENKRLNDLTYDGNGDWLLKRYCVLVEKVYLLEIENEKLKSANRIYEIEKKEYDCLKPLLEKIDYKTKLDHEINLHEYYKNH